MMSILVVDDDRTSRHLTESLLKREGWKVTGAKDGVDALKLLRTRRFTVMLLDVWMPRMNGLELWSSCAPGAPAARRGDDIGRNARHVTAGRARPGVHLRAQAGGPGPAD